jgi:FAD/FMN-containing dehydrogenase
MNNIPTLKPCIRGSDQACYRGRRVCHCQCSPRSILIFLHRNTTDQVQVKVAAQHNISYMATGGGHGLPISLGQLDDAISIDLSSFKTVKMNTKSKTVTVGGGALFSDVIPSVLNAGYELGMLDPNA